jgi:hypothetical protein
MSTPTKSIVLDLTATQITVLKSARRSRADQCNDLIYGLVSTGNGKTAIADHWRTELATAEQLLAIVRKAAAANTSSITNQEQS